jgi:hypothetical protein
MIRRSSKLKEIFKNSQQFMNDVYNEITGILEDMQDVTTNGVCSSSSSPSRNEPKSEVFTTDMDKHYPSLSSVSHFRDGQLKLQ